jgi:hypothetical protein
MRLFAFGFVLLGAIASPQPASAQNDAQRAAFERGLLSADSGLYARLKRDFPQDYDLMIRELSREALASGSNRQVMEQAGFRAMRGFYASKLSAIVNAPPSALAAYNAAELNFVRKLAAQDAALCRTYVLTGFAPGTVVPTALRHDMAQIGFAMLAAAKAGTGRPVDPARGQPPSADFPAWVDKMRQLDPSDEMRRYLGGDQSAAADPVAGCRMGTAVYQSITMLPPDQSARITAYLIASNVNRSR